MFQMNKQRESHMSGEEHHSGGHGKHPHMAIHSHSKGHTVHITHPDGQSETHEHEPGDAEGMAQHIHNNFGGGEPSQPVGEEPEGYGV